MANLFLNQIYFDSLKYININISHGNLCFAKSCGKYFESLIWNSYKAITFPNIYIYVINISLYVFIYTFFFFIHIQKEWLWSENEKRYKCSCTLCFFFFSSCSSIEKKLWFSQVTIYTFIFIHYIFETKHSLKRWTRYKNSLWLLVSEQA